MFKYALNCRVLLKKMDFRGWRRESGEAEILENPGVQRLDYLKKHTLVKTCGISPWLFGTTECEKPPSAAEKGGLCCYHLEETNQCLIPYRSDIPDVGVSRRKILRLRRDGK